MAVTSTLKRRTGSMRFKVGVDSKGKDVYRTVTLSNISGESTDEDITNILLAVNALMPAHCAAKELNKDEKYKMLVLE